MRAALWAIPVLSIVPLLLGRHVLWGVAPGSIDYKCVGKGFIGAETI
jgi:hypothetical protein